MSQSLALYSSLHKQEDNVIFTAVSFCLVGDEVAEINIMLAAC